MSKKKVVVSLGHEALGYTTTQQQNAVKITARALADLIEEDYQLTITHSNGPQVSMIHKAMSELRRVSSDYTPAPMCVCSAMSQGYVGFDLQNSLRSELLGRGISKPVSTILTQVTVDPYDEAFYEPTKVIGRYMSREEAEAELKKGNYVKEYPGKGYRRIVAAPTPIDIVEIETIRTLVNADQVVIACGGGGIPVIEQHHGLKGASAVIEKDAIAGKLAAELASDELIILTGVDHVCRDFGKADPPDDHSPGPGNHGRRTVRSRDHASQDRSCHFLSVQSALRQSPDHLHEGGEGRHPGQGRHGDLLQLSIAEKHSDPLRLSILEKHDDPLLLGDTTLKSEWCASCTMKS